jgi:hypothetical protein
VEFDNIQSSRGGVAQLGERRVRNAKVGSSILLLSTIHTSKNIPKFSDVLNALENQRSRAFFFRQIDPADAHGFR